MLFFMGRRPFVQQRILEAAFDLFATEGYEAVSTRQIAARAKVGPASMFRHFPSKEALARALYPIALAPLTRALAVVADAPDAATAVRAIVSILYRAYDERPRALALLIFPPHEITPWEVDVQNPEHPRHRLGRLVPDGDLVAILWGAIVGPLQDRYLRIRSGPMAVHAAAHADRIVRLLDSGGRS